jgi:hypothetical protein
MHCVILYLSCFLGQSKCFFYRDTKGHGVSFSWIAGVCILAVASFVFGLTGFGIGLMSLSLLPFFVPPTTVVPLITIFRR